MKPKRKSSASIEEIKRLYMRADLHYRYKRKEKYINRIEAFLLQTTILEGVLVNFGLKLLEKRADLTALMGKRKDRYGYDNAINDLYLLGAITTEEFKDLERYKNKRNKYLHGLLLKNIGTTAKEVNNIYKDYRMLTWNMVKKLENKLIN